MRRVASLLLILSIVLLSFIGCGRAAFAQDAEQVGFDNVAAKEIGFESYRMKHKNAFTISLFDSALLYSINYDRILLDWLGVGIGG